MAGSGAAAGLGNFFEGSQLLPPAGGRPGCGFSTADSSQRRKNTPSDWKVSPQSAGASCQKRCFRAGFNGNVRRPVSAKPKPGKSALIWKEKQRDEGRDGFLMLCIKKPHKRYKAYDDVPDAVKIDVLGFRFGRENGCKKSSGSLARPITSRSKSRLAALSKRKDTQSGVFPFQKG